MLNYSNYFPNLPSSFAFPIGLKEKLKEKYNNPANPANFSPAFWSISAYDPDLDKLIVNFSNFSLNFWIIPKQNKIEFVWTPWPLTINDKSVN